MSIEQNNQYPGFEYSAPELSAYLLSMATGVFSISLTNGNVTHFKAVDSNDFKKWLTENNVRDINKRQNAKEKDNQKKKK